MTSDWHTQDRATVIPHLTFSTSGPVLGFNRTAFFVCTIRLLPFRLLPLQGVTRFLLSTNLPLFQISFKEPEIGFEPMTSCLQDRRCYQLSYPGINAVGGGLEPPR